MTRASSHAPVRGVLLDIEGTTTPVAFVHQTLFPYARARIRPFLEREGPDLRPDLAALREEHAADRRRGLTPPPWEADRDLDAAVGYVDWLMDQDRKSTVLKSLQGRIWEEGYRSGELRGQVYPDVPVAFDRWMRRGKGVWIFSSGSVLAQRLLFAHSTAGDLTSYLRGYFDTTTGPKTAEESYRRIAAAAGLPSETMLFVSDTVGELDAARQAGLETALCMRQAGALPSPGAHPVVHDLDGVGD